MSAENQGPQQWPLWIGIATAIFAAGGTWHVQGERTSKHAITIGDHETRLRNLELRKEIAELKELISELKTGQQVHTTKLDLLEQRVRELGEPRRRR